MMHDFDEIKNRPVSINTGGAIVITAALLAFHKSFERSTFQARILPIPIRKGMLEYQ